MVLVESCLKYCYFIQLSCLSVSFTFPRHQFYQGHYAGVKDQIYWPYYGAEMVPFLVMLLILLNGGKTTSNSGVYWSQYLTTNLKSRSNGRLLITMLVFSIARIVRLIVKANLHTNTLQCLNRLSAYQYYFLFNFFRDYLIIDNLAVTAMAFINVIIVTHFE